MHRLNHQLLFIPILCSLATLALSAASIYLPSLPSIGLTLGVEKGFVQWTLTTFFVGSFFGSLVLGPLSDRLGRVIVVKLGLLVFIAASYMCAVSQSIFDLEYGRFVQGFAASAGLLASRAIGRDLFEGVNLTRFSALLILVISLSRNLAIPLGGIIDHYFGWRVIFYFLIYIAIAILILVWLWLPETRINTDKAPVPVSFFSHYSVLFKTPYFIMLCCIMGIQLAIFYCYLSLSPFIFITLFEWPTTEYAYLGFVNATGTLLGFFLTQFFANRYSQLNVIFTSCLLYFLISVVYIGTYFYIPFKPYVLILFCTFFFCTSTIIISNAMAASLQIFPHIAGNAAAIMNAVQFSLAILGSGISSYLPNSPLALGTAIGGLSLASLIIAFYVKKHASC
ncbi:MAG: multidrug effflux MFS transporter [Alphaproteobacteria bacterium]|nr:multidrug effflux MFS transporter [Alphaproteobacteria bacterium]